MIQDLYKAKRSLELKWEQEHLSNGRYTLEMVRIDDKVKKVITDIKLEEARIAHLQNIMFGRAGAKRNAAALLLLCHSAT